VLLLDHGQLSRADLARLTNLNKPTISNLVAGLIEDGLVREIGSGVSTGGRKPILLEVQDTSRLVVGVEIDASACRLLLVTLNGEHLAATTVPLAATDLAAVTDAISAGIDMLFADRQRSALLGCGIAIPGLVDRVNDTVALPAPFDWDAAPLSRELEERLDAPVLITDRGKAAGLGEMWVLGKEQAHDVIYLYLGRGVAGAVVLGQEIHWGVSSIAGEIGHMAIDPNGPHCSCGRTGCLEALVSTSAILSRVYDLSPLHPASPLLASLARDGAEAVAAIGDAAAAGDPLAIEVVESTARWIGLAIANLVNVLNPAAVVLGGPTAEWGDPLLRAIEREVDRSALPLARQATAIVIGQAGDLATPLGASALVLQRAAELLTRVPRTPATRIQAGG
jgi:glucokinase-like ROK family protein